MFARDDANPRSAMSLSPSLLSLLQLALMAVLLLLGLAFVTGVSFARSACRRVFNREPPPGLVPGLLLPMLRVIRPFGMLWRLATAPLRCLPDVYVLGEVRCGTTTVASLLRDELGMAGPFTPWVHPLANEKVPPPTTHFTYRSPRTAHPAPLTAHRAPLTPHHSPRTAHRSPLAAHQESFFLVGHYWGYVPRWAYRMCSSMSKPGPIGRPKRLIGRGWPRLGAAPGNPLEPVKRARRHSGLS